MLESAVGETTAEPWAPAWSLELRQDSEVVALSALAATLGGGCHSTIGRSLKAHDAWLEVDTSSAHSASFAGTTRVTYWIDSVCTEVKAPPGLKRRPMPENRLASVTTRSRPNFPSVAGYFLGTVKAVWPDGGRVMESVARTWLSSSTKVSCAWPLVGHVGWQSQRLWSNRCDVKAEWRIPCQTG